MFLVATVVFMPLIGFGISKSVDAGTDRDVAANARRAVVTRERGNIVRADRIIDAQDADDSSLERSRVDLIFPIIDPVTEIPLQPVERDRYIALIARHRGSCSLATQPAIRDGRIVGSKPFSGPPPFERCRSTEARRAFSK